MTDPNATSREKADSSFRFYANPQRRSKKRSDEEAADNRRAPVELLERKIFLFRSAGARKRTADSPVGGDDGGAELSE